MTDKDIDLTVTHDIPAPFNRDVRAENELMLFMLLLLMLIYAE